MGTKSNAIPVYTVDVFATDDTFFWMGRLEGILDEYPHLASPHKQMFYSLMYVEEPGVRVVIEDEIIHLNRSEVICIKPGSIITVDMDKPANGQLVCFTESFFSLRYNNNVLHQFNFLDRREPGSIHLDETRSKQWYLLASLMLDEYERLSVHREKVLRSYLNIILNELDRCNAALVSTEPASGKLEKVMQFEKLVDEYYTGLKAPAGYAAKLHITTNYLNKLCREYRSTTAGDLIRKRVIIEARRLLHYTTLSVGEIADQLGFENFSYFITFFKKSTGTTPEAFRRREK